MSGMHVPMVGTFTPDIVYNIIVLSTVPMIIADEYQTFFFCNETFFSSYTIVSRARQHFLYIL